ncbi:hypothetical protein F4815DRAFT_223542 [Daldinia loculata]|nr:hypothetical protein F4815DRAFT_223542 [Daldinia loculata]
MLELEREFLTIMSVEDMSLLRSFTSVVINLLWLTGANILSDPDTNLTLPSGSSRAIMFEQPALRFSVLDLGSLNSIEPRSSFEMALTIYNDKEFIQVGDVLYTSRFVPNLTINSLFRRRMEYQDPSRRKNF